MQFEEMTRLQERVSEVMALRREQDRCGELSDVRRTAATSADAKDPAASRREGYSIIERRVTELEAQLRTSSRLGTSRRRQANAGGPLLAQHPSYHVSASSTAEPRRIDGTPPSSPSSLAR